MLLTEIKNVFNQRIPLDEFRKGVESEIVEYKKCLNKKDGSSPVYLNADMDYLLIKKEDVRFLCESFLNSNLDKWELNYLSEGLLLSDHVTFENPKVEDAFWAFTEVDFFKLVNQQYIRRVLEDLFD